MTRFCALLVVLFLCGCVPRELLYASLGRERPVLRDFGPEFEPPLSFETDRPVSGFGGNGGGVQRTPVIFVHGNSVGADYWKPARAAFKAAGYTDDELWAVGYGWESTRALDNATLSAVTLERFVQEVQRVLQKKTGRKIERFDLVSHSLGVTLVREWMRQTNSHHKVRAFVGIAGANQGTWTASADTRGQNRVVGFELHTGSPWLKQLDRIGQTPGPVHYYTVYDGTGTYDFLFPKPLQDSSRLEGALVNLAINRETGSHHDHLNLGRAADSLAQVIDWLTAEKQILPGTAAPNVVRVGAVLRADQPQARLYCARGEQQPRLEGPGEISVPLVAAEVVSCFAYQPQSALASPLARFQQPAPAQAATLRLSAQPSAGAYANPQTVQLQASEPDALITYTTVGKSVSTGSPRYLRPIFIPGPVRLVAQAFAADGRVSEPLHLEYNISIQKADAEHAWLRQLNAQAPEVFSGSRTKGN